VVIDQAFLIRLTIVTPLGAYVPSRRRLGLATGRLGASALSVLQPVGMSPIFCVSSIAIGLAGILVVRGATEVFLSAYLLRVVTLCALSVLQGLGFECWRAGGRLPGA
jgi:hypothetical protein